jgi:integrase
MPKSKMTFKAIADHYLLESAMRHSPQWHKTIRGVVQHVLTPQWGEKPVADIRRADAIQLVTTIAARAPHRAAKVGTVISAIFDLALLQGILEATPMSGLSMYVPKKPPKRRQRILTLLEIEKIWDTLANVPGDEACKRAAKTILVTGQPPRVVAGMHRSEITGDCWTIPAGRCRGGHRHVYLSPLALDLIGDQDGYIFSPAGGNQHIEFSALTRLIRKVNNLPHCKMDPWTARDLRNTVVHHMAKSCISAGTRTAIFGKPQYNKFSPVLSIDADVKAALSIWSTELLRLLKKGAVLAPTPPMDIPSFGL